MNRQFYFLISELQQTNIPTIFMRFKHYNRQHILNRIQKHKLFFATNIKNRNV